MGMIMEDAALRRAATILGAFLCAIFPACSLLKDKPKPPPPLEYSIMSPYYTTHTFAIAPAVNYSGNREFDPFAVSDTLFQEFQQVRNLNSLPLNKTLIAMRKLNMHAINSVNDAQLLIRTMGVDGLVVPAVTAYNPYNPPTVGMILQLYTLDSFDPKAAANGGGVAVDGQPVDQVSAVFNASNQTVLHELRDFASGRTEYETALQDEKFLVDSDAYMRFVAHAMIRRLVEAERQRGMVR